MLPVTFGIHKTFLLAGSLAARLGPKPVYRNAECRGGAYAKLPKASNGSKLRAQGMQNTSQQKCFPLPLEAIKHVLWPAPSLRGWVRNQHTATPIAVEEVMRSFRKPRTAARFVPKACKTQARKKAAKNGAFATLPHGAETAGNGSEKAKRHYKPSSGKPKTMRSQPFHTVPKLQLRSRKKKTQVKDRSR